MFEELLLRFNLNKTQLTPDEIATLKNWADSLSQKTINVPEITEHIRAMLSAVERELHGYENPPTFVAWLFRGSRRRNLEARAMNYLMLLDFLTQPEKAKRYVEKQVERVASAIHSKRRPF